MMIDLKQKDLEGLNSNDEHIIVANRFIIQKKIGKGSFGEVFKGYDKDTKESVAIKIELSKTFKTKALIEGKILKKLQNFELLGPNLEDILNYCDKKLSLKTLQRMENIHNRGFLHRDVKSDNFLIGSGDNINKIYAIDFGLSKRYVHPHTGQHILIKQNKGMIGTARFASINAHLGLEQSRRDDLQAIGYLIVYLAKGALPWQKIKGKSKEQKYKKILDLKESFTPELLTSGLPDEFNQYLSYVKKLQFEDKPDYSYLRNLFVTLLSRNGLDHDLVFDWMIPKSKRQIQRKKIRRKLMTMDIPQDQMHQLVLNGSETDKEKELKETSEIDVHKDNKLQTELLSKDQMVQKNIENMPFSTYSTNQNSCITTDKDLIIGLPQIQPNQLQIIQEINEDQNPSLSQKLQQKLNCKIHSDMFLNNFKSKLIPETKETFMKEKIKLLRQRNSSNNILILKKRNSSMGVKSNLSSDLMNFEEANDIEEEITSTQNVYQFNINKSKIQIEKSLTPSPIKSRAMVTKQYDGFNYRLQGIIQQNQIENNSYHKNREHVNSQSMQEKEKVNQDILNQEFSHLIEPKSEDIKLNSDQDQFQNKNKEQDDNQCLFCKPNTSSNNSSSSSFSAAMTRKQQFVDKTNSHNSDMTKVHDFILQQKVINSHQIIELEQSQRVSYQITVKKFGYIKESESEESEEQHSEGSVVKENG